MPLDSRKPIFCAAKVVELLVEDVFLAEDVPLEGDVVLLEPDVLVDVILVVAEPFTLHLVWMLIKEEALRVDVELPAHPPVEEGVEWDEEGAEWDEVDVEGVAVDAMVALLLIRTIWIWIWIAICLVTARLAVLSSIMILTVT